MNITSEESRGQVLSALLKLKISCFTPVFGSIANHVSIFLPRKKTGNISWNIRRLIVFPMSVFYLYTVNLTDVQPVLIIPVYRMPSLLLHGDDATNCGTVKGNFLRASLSEVLSTYNDPPLGSGKKRGLKTE